MFVLFRLFTNIHVQQLYTLQLFYEPFPSLKFNFNPCDNQEAARG